MGGVGVVRESFCKGMFINRFLLLRLKLFKTVRIVFWKLNKTHDTVSSLNSLDIYTGFVCIGLQGPWSQSYMDLSSPCFSLHSPTFSRELLSEMMQQNDLHMSSLQFNSQKLLFLELRTS